MMPTESEREDGPTLATTADVQDLGIGERNLAALDHRHPLAVMHFELLRALPESQEDDEHPGKHAEDEDQREQFFGLHGELQILAAWPDCFRPGIKQNACGSSQLVISPDGE